MKLGIISDLHIDKNQKALRNNQSYLDLLVDLAIGKELDALLMAGDLSDHYLESQDFINGFFNRSGIPIYFTPGNHDFWSIRHNQKDSQRIYRYFLNQRGNLIHQPQRLNDEWVLVGSPGWYDYGYGDKEKYSEEFFAKKKYKIAAWNDLYYVDWQRSDQEVSQYMLENLKKDLDQVKDKNVILMTHVATHPKMTVPLPHRVYDFANAYLGAKSYEQLYSIYPNIKVAINGHVHFRASFHDSGVKYISACLGNRKHWRYKDNPLREMENTLQILKI